MRRQRTAPAGVWQQLEARLNMYRLHANQLLDEVAVHAEQQVPRFDVLEHTPTVAARLVRTQWRMPIGPVRSLVAWLEAAGCLVVAEDFATARVDGLSQWAGAHPVMLVNARTPVDRVRWTLAHELGHLVLHEGDASAFMEAEADEFAAEFLLPAEVIRPQLRRLDLGKLHDLERQWAVSMAALIERADSLQLFSPVERTRFYKARSARGWLTREPLCDELAPEQPRLARDIADTLHRRGLSDSDIAAAAGFATPEQNTLFRAAAAPTTRMLLLVPPTA